MIEALLVVLSRPRPGRDDDFNDWYSNIHIRDAMRLRGAIATQRFRLSDRQIDGYHNPLGWKYLALYEVSDAQRFTREHVEAAGTVRMLTTGAFDISVINDYHYYLTQFRDNAPGETAAGGVILEQIKARVGRELDFQRWYNDEYLPDVARRPGVKSATSLKYRPVGQMLPTDSEFDFIGVYHLSDVAARDRWPSPNPLATSPLVEPVPLAVTCWDVLMPRLTKDAVLNPTSELLASEERARVHMGNRAVGARPDWWLRADGATAKETVMTEKNSRTVAVVTGASRGLGRGIARAFGSKGARVYLTGRGTGTGALEQAAAEVRAAGGEGIAVVCDHSDDAQARALFDRVRTDSGRLDILVNNAAAVYPQELAMPGPFWEKPLRLVDMIDVGLRSNYVASYYAAPIFAGQRSGLIANISFYGAVSYFHGPAYGAAKAGTDKLSYDMAVDFRPYGVAVVSIWPGFVRTEMVAAMPVETLPADVAANLRNFESPEFTGLVIDALSRDPMRMDLSGQALIGAELAERYGIVDLDGRSRPSYRSRLGEPYKAVLCDATLTHLFDRCDRLDRSVLKRGNLSRKS